MWDEVKHTILKSWPSQDFDHLGMAIFNLKEQSFELCEFHQGEEKTIAHFYYDLASLTKPFTMGALAAKSPELFEGDKLLMLEHRAGIPAWAILGRSDWDKTVSRFKVKESGPVYSDLSMLKLMLLLEKETGRDFKSLCDFYWDSELCFWKDLPDLAITPDTGFRKGAVINGEVNDDNCFKINRFCSHAGLFGTLSGTTKSLLRLEEETGLTSFISEKFKSHQGRFIWGWDTVSDPQNTLAGIGAPKHTFGHLGFTGTSVWIDSNSGKGWLLLTNATRKYWYHRKGLNELRKSLGAIVWTQL